jgi:YYY domain-containing protein
VRGGTQEVIDEFPQFSFLLGDMHPHVLALPFTLLALAAALNLIKSKLKTENFFGFPLLPFDFSLLPLILGGLFFLNTWDILPYSFILVAAFAMARYRAENKWDALATRGLVRFVIALGALSVLLYFPFYLGFQSQAGGILPVLFVKTRLQQYLVMFGLFVFVLGFFLVRALRERGDPVSERFTKIVTSAAPFFGFPIAIALIAILVVVGVPPVRDSIAAFLPGSTGSPLYDILNAFVMPLVSDPWLYLLLASILTITLYLLRARIAQLDTTTLFVLLITFTGFLLTYGVEFVYLRDQFATRMNTVFKFYFQTWTLFSVAGGYAVWYLSTKLNGAARMGWFAGFGILLAASFVYPTFAIPSRADGFKGTATLDGLKYIQNVSRGDYDAIQWLRENAPRGSVIVEAVGDAYSYGNRISMATGLATPLGWVNHENQWRGSSKLFKDEAAGIDREADVRRIYQSLDAEETLTLLAKYDIKFVVVGGMEKNKYGLSSVQLNKFNRILKFAYESGDARIFAR